MAGPVGQLDSAAHAPLGVRLRGDLSFHAQQQGFTRRWVVKDPVAQTYFHLRDEEYVIVQMLAERISFAEIKRRFEERFAPMQLTFEQLQGFIARLHSANLLLAEHPGQGDELLARRDRQRWQARLQFLQNLLAIRFRGIDPEPWLDELYPLLRWIFALWFLGACLAWVLAAAALAAIEFDTFRQRLPELQAFFSVQNVFWLALAIVLAKLLHEVGHALTNKHFGGECHELGVILVLFTPCLYCNVSDAWLLRSKWQRIAVSAAGIIVELTLAATCVFLWWFSQPGLFNTLCLCIAGVCSINSLLFNGNPLLRYDGYYMLSDLLEIPNLSQQAQRQLSRFAGGLFLGLDGPQEPTLSLSQRLLLTLYGIASTVYRWLVMLAILWLAHRTLKPYGFEAVAEAFAWLVVAGLVLSPLRSLFMLLQNPLHRQRLRVARAAVIAAVLVIVVGLVGMLPLPARVRAPLVVQLRDPHCVYVSVPGRLSETTPAGTKVRKDQVLGRLVNRDVAKQITELRVQRDQQRLQVQHLKLRLTTDARLAPQIPAAEELLADVENRLRQRENDQARLVLRAPVDGVVLPPPARLGRTYRPGALAAWRGTPLDENNLQTYLETGTLFCVVGDPQALEAQLLVEQADMKFVRPGQQVRMQLDELPGGVLAGAISEIAKTDVRVLPRELAAGKQLPTVVNQEGVARPTETSYQARVTFADAPQRLLLGDRGQAKILVAPQSLWQRLRRFLEGTFRFRL